MNSKKVKEIAKKRLQYLFSSTKGSDNGETTKIKWDINKEFNLSFHDKSTCEHEIILNPDTFQGIEENDFIEIISTSNSELRILFKIKKQNLDKIKSSISILSVYNELIKNYHENLNKSSVYVRPANISDYYVDKLTILFKEQFISRKDIFQISQSLINNIVYINKDVKLLPNPENDEITVANVSSFKGTKLKLPLTGLVTSNTEFQFRSLSSGLYYLIEISKDTYDFSLACKTKFEMIIEFLKNTITKLKESECTHVINIIFFTRIYFQEPNVNKLIQNINGGNTNNTNSNSRNSTANGMFEYIYQSTIFPNEFFFDVYSNIIKSNINKLDTIEMVKILYKAFNVFASIFNVKNLSEYMNEIRSSFGVKMSESESNKSSMTGQTNNPGNSNGNTYFKRNSSDGTSIAKNNPFMTFENSNIFGVNSALQLSFNNFYSPKFFESIENFRMTKSVTSNIFEAINVVINDLKYEKKKLYKLGNIITVIASGDYFPYYNLKLSKITKENLFEQGIPCCMVMLANKNKAINLIRKGGDSYYEDNGLFNKDRDRDNINNLSLSLIRDRENTLNTISNFTKYDKYDTNPFNLNRTTSKDDQNFYSARGMTPENELRFTIAKNNDILENFNERCCGQERKYSTDTYSLRESGIKSLNFNICNLVYPSLPKYLNEADVFSHRTPKWIRIFSITNYNISHVSGNGGVNNSNNNSNNISNLYKKGIKTLTNPYGGYPGLTHGHGLNMASNNSLTNLGINTTLSAAFVYPPSSSSMHIKGTRKMSINPINEVNLCIPENIDGDIFNAKKKTDASEMVMQGNSSTVQSPIMKNIESDEYVNLTARNSLKYNNLRKKFSLKIENQEEIIQGGSNGNSNSNANSNSSKVLKGIIHAQNQSSTYSNNNTQVQPEHNLSLKSLKDSLNIYTNAYTKLKSKGNEESEETYSLSAIAADTTRTRKQTNKNISNEYSKTQEYQELMKRVNEYENEIFSKKLSRRNSQTRDKGNNNINNHNNPESSEKVSTSRNLVELYEFSTADNSDEFSMIIELLTQVPLLPIFGEFDTREIKEGVKMAPHQLSSLNSDADILEEIIFERINNNYQIVRPKHPDDYLKPIDLKNIGSIQLFDRRFYHIILAEDQNYKVQIYNYSKKINKYSAVPSTSKFEDTGNSIIIEHDFIFMEYAYFIYHPKVNLLSGKRLRTSLGEKNEVFWSKYDIWLNDLQLNMKQIKFINELNFLLVDRLDENLRKKKTKIVSAAFGSCNSSVITVSKVNVSTVVRDESLSSQPNSPRISSNNILSITHSTGNHGSVCSANNTTNISTPTTNTGNPNNATTNPNNSTEDPFKDRLKSLISNIESYLSKYPKFVDKFNNKILYLSSSQTQNSNPLKYSIITLNKSSDWILITHNTYFNERNALFFSLKWLSCNSIPIHNFNKDLAKKVKIKNLGLIKIPSDDIVYSSFKRISLWKIPNNKYKLLDKVLGRGLMSNFLRCEYDSNCIYFHEEYNLLLKISQPKGILYLHDEIIENSDNYFTSNHFIEYALNIEMLLDIFDFTHQLLDRVEFLVRNNH